MYLVNKIPRLILFILIIKIIQTAKSREPPPKFLVRPNKIYCETDNKTVLTEYCYLKPYSRYLVTVNIGFGFLISITKPIYTQLLLFYRYGTIFRQIIDTKQIEWCSFMEGSATNPLITAWMGLLNQSMPHVFHECPYEGKLELSNFSLTGNTLKEDSGVFPQGYYRLVLTFSKKDNVFIKVRLEGENTSTLKESFG